jgi:hypothetical protein
MRVIWLIGAFGYVIGRWWRPRPLVGWLCLLIALGGSYVIGF